MKYVRVAGEYRFGEEHKELVNQGEKALSAGFIIITNRGFKVLTTPSMSLGIGPDALDSARLELVLQLEEI